MRQADSKKFPEASSDYPHLTPLFLSFLSVTFALVYTISLVASGGTRLDAAWVIIVVLLMSSFAVLSGFFIAAQRQKKVIALSEALRLSNEGLEEAKVDAQTDRLTGIYNRRFWDRALFREMEKSNRDGTPFAVVMVDIDDMASINKAGHDAGDRALRAVAYMLTSVQRSSDVVSRWGGDEFAVLLCGIRTGPQAALAFEQRFRRALDFRTLRGDDLADAPPVSIGYSVYARGKTPVDMEREASQRCLRVKETSKTSKIHREHTERMTDTGRIDVSDVVFGGTSQPFDYSDLGLNEADG